jgi:cation:H+ antiporter
LGTLGNVWLQFILLTGAIAVSGTQLCRYGDVLAEKTGLGRAWLGLVVLAAVTSLPETATGVSAVLWVNAPDITVGDLLGSCVFNLLILAVVDLLHPPGPALTVADRGHILAASFGVVMLAVAVMGVMAPSPLTGYTLAHVGLSGPVLLVCYLVAMRSVFRYQQRQREAQVGGPKQKALYGDLSIRAAAVNFGLNALVVLAAGIFLPRVAQSLAQLMGWKQSLVGTVFVAASTSLPELVVTIASLQLGAVDLAVGNLFGSNLVNLALLGVMELLYFKGPMLEAVSPQHAGTGMMAIAMTGIAVAEMMYRPQHKALRWMSLGAFTLAFLYVAHIFLQMLAR